MFLYQFNYFCRQVLELCPDWPQTPHLRPSTFRVKRKGVNLTKKGVNLNIALINHIILGDHFNTIEWTFMKFFNHQIEPSYHEFTLQHQWFLNSEILPLKKLKSMVINKIKYPSNINKYQCWEFLTFWNLT
jgi:hypothetical protein